jgi:DNA-binding helix-hairpin-helix protein with protein kinase domain
MDLVLQRGRATIRVGRELGRGGEGSVFAIEGRQDQVVKIYSVPPDSLKVSKLLAMIETASPSLLRIAAWPLDLCRDKRGTPQGFTMPRVAARRDIHELYSPKSRSEAFPESDFLFLAHVAGNIARAFAVVHAQGHVIGDVNHGNLLVGPDGTVMLIDCDSFQVRSGARVFTCDVGVPLFTAPELHGCNLRGTQRTIDHDLFALAVLLFHLLYMGRHPFAGRYSGAGDMPIERAIAEYRFAYGSDRAAHGMERPPGTISLETLGATVSHLFMEAFGRVGINAGRPGTTAWIGALDKLKSSLRVCALARWHQYPEGLSSCPWCNVEKQTGVRLFGQRIVATEATGAVDIAALWQAIEAVPNPSADPALPSELPWSSPPGVPLPSVGLKMVRQALSLLLVCVGFIGCTFVARDGGFLPALILYGFAAAVWPHISPQKLTEATKALTAAQGGWDLALLRWKREASREAFAAKKRELEAAKAELADLPNERRRRFAQLEGERENRQRQRYLDRFRIDRARIRGIGPGRTTMLASYGIETAADIQTSTILQIPGFGEALTSELVQWRQRHERNFQFNPHEPIDRRDLEAMDRALQARRQELISILRQGSVLLRRIHQEILAARPRLMPILEEAWAALKIAEIRRKAL